MEIRHAAPEMRTRSWEETYREQKEVFEKEHPIAFRLMEIGGVHPDRIIEIPNPYLDGEIDREDFRNVGEHCIAVGICAKRIADSLVGKGVLEAASRDEIVLRALMHDSNKRFEVMRKKAQKAGRDVDVYGDKGYETMFQYISMQNPELVQTIGTYLKSAGSETGHNSLKDFVCVNEQGQPYLNYRAQLPEMIVHLADDMTASVHGSTQWVTCEERTLICNFKERYPFIYKEGFGFDAEGNTVLVKDVSMPPQGLRSVKTYVEWQLVVAKLISEEIVWMLGEEGDAEQTLKQICNT